MILAAWWHFLFALSRDLLFSSKSHLEDIADVAEKHAAAFKKPMTQCWLCIYNVLRGAVCHTALQLYLIIPEAKGQ